MIAPVILLKTQLRNRKRTSVTLLEINKQAKRDATLQALIGFIQKNNWHELDKLTKKL